MAVALVGMLMILSTCAPAFEARVRAPERPVVPNVTATSPTEIKMSWCRVKPNNIEIDHYELYIDNELEYSGIDVMYVAKRLKPWTWYEIKLRSCGFQPGFSCSPFSRPKLVMTLADSENVTDIPSTATVFKIVVLPTYMFIAGVLVGVAILAMALVTRYLQSNDSWMNEPAFELPTHIQLQGRTCLNGKIAKLNLFQLSYYVEAKNDPSEKEKEKERKDPSPKDVYHQIIETEEGICSINKAKDDFVGRKEEIVVDEMKESLSISDLITVTAVEDGTPHDDSTLCSNNAHLCHFKNEASTEKSHSDLGNGQVKDVVPLEQDRTTNSDARLCSGKTLDGACHQNETMENSYSSPSDGKALKDGNPEQEDNLRASHLSLKCTKEEGRVERPYTSMVPQLSVPKSKTIQQAEQVKGVQINQISSSSGVTQDETKGAVVVIDNSNIYIGAQECASATNTGERKRHVRVKLQNLVKILEKNRTRERSFVCGSSPPATEHVWDVYRHLGYVVDLEDRRGKDEQRVDEGLHLFIYKAICELSPRILVLASGDGMKGKSENSTSFPGCATMALEKGWHVEVYSWKHSLSTEWHKLAKKYPEHLSIHYLDKYVNHITFVDGKHGRKCLPLTGASHERERTGCFELKLGRLTYHNG